MSRIQLALNVDDLDESLAFYRRLLGAEPAKVRPGYANFDVADPPLKLVLIENPGRGGSLNHLGVEVDDTAAVDDVRRRLETDGLRARGGARRHLLLRDAGQVLGRGDAERRALGGLHGPVGQPDGQRHLRGGRHLLWRRGGRADVGLLRLLSRDGRSAGIGPGPEGTSPLPPGRPRRLTADQRRRGRMHQGEAQGAVLRARPGSRPRRLAHPVGGDVEPIGATGHRTGASAGSATSCAARARRASGHARRPPRQRRDRSVSLRSRWSELPHADTSSSYVSSRTAARSVGTSAPGSSTFGRSPRRSGWGCNGPHMKYISRLLASLLPASGGGDERRQWQWSRRTRGQRPAPAPCRQRHPCHCRAGDLLPVVG